MMVRIPRRLNDELEPLSNVKPHVAISTAGVVVVARTREVAVAVWHRTNISVDAIATPALVAVFKTSETVSFDFACGKALLSGGAAGVPVHSVVVEGPDVVFGITIRCRLVKPHEGEVGGM